MSKKEYKGKTSEKRRSQFRKAQEKRAGSTYLVYKHTLGDKTYFGCGSHIRPYSNKGKQRGINWHEAFPTNPKVTILAEFKHREIAEVFEAWLIRNSHDTELVNQQYPKLDLTKLLHLDVNKKIELQFSEGDKGVNLNQPQ